MQKKDKNILPPLPSKTLFDPHYHEYMKIRAPYYLSVRLIEESNDESFPQDEVCIFSHVLEHEVAFYEPRGLLAGDIKLRINNTHIYSIGDYRSFILPNWVEEDGLEIVECKAKGILLVEHDIVFKNLTKSNRWKKLGLILATGYGIPRSELRRFLRRLSLECSLPIYLLTDNDVWGYFIFSVLKRGLMGPHEECKYLSITNLRHLGLFANDIGYHEKYQEYIRPWKRQFDLRLNYVNKYVCFRSEEWQKEFKLFKENNCAIDLKDFYTTLGEEAFIDGYLADRVSNGRWKT